MKAILIDEQNHLQWTDVPDPVTGPADVLVKIAAAALNRADLMQREGKYPPPPGAPEWMGLEIAGTIVEMGAEAAEKSGFSVGDPVCALLGGGGYAQYVSVRYDMLMHVPAGCSMIEAAAMPEAFATAYLDLFIEGGLQSGNTLLVTAGGSGLASVAIPMAKAFGARVITTVRSEEKARTIAPLGADVIVNTRTEELSSVLKREEAAGHPVDVALDCVGGSEVGACLQTLAHGARWIMIATLGGDPTTVDLKDLYKRNVRLIGSTLRSRTPDFKAALLHRLEEQIWPLVEEGKIRPTIYKVLPITQAEEAQAILYRNENVGKVVMKVE